MIRIKGTCDDDTIRLDKPTGLPNGTEVVVDVYTTVDAEDDAWRDLGVDRLTAEWTNPDDAIYDNWRELYGV